MAALMLLDHLYYFLPGAGYPQWFTVAGRMVAPVFCFLMTQSLRHTRDRRRYIARLAGAGVLMWAGNLAVMFFVRLKTGLAIPLTSGIFLSLALGALTVDTVERALAGQREGLVLRAALLLCAAPLVEGMFLIPVLSVVFCLYAENKPLLCLLYAVLGTAAVFLLLLQAGPPSPRFTVSVAGIRFHTQYLHVLALAPILLYNGRPGPRGGFYKRVFYLFYPLHIWVLYLVAALR
jgi:hypothetical protein